MPVTGQMPYQWYNTPNIHLCTLRDFEQLAGELGLRILERATFNEAREVKLMPSWRTGGLPLRGGLGASSRAARHATAGAGSVTDGLTPPPATSYNCGTPRARACCPMHSARGQFQEIAITAAAANVYASPRVAPLLVLGFASGCRWR